MQKNIYLILTVMAVLLLGGVVRASSPASAGKVASHLVALDAQLNGGTPFYIEQDTVILQNGAFCLPALANGYEDIAGFQYTLSFNPDVLAFDSVSYANGALSLNSSLSQDSYFVINDSTVSVTFIANQALGQTIPDSSLLFELCFTPIAGGNSDVAIIGFPTPAEFSDGDGVVTSFNNDGLSNGGVEVLLCEDTTVIIDDAICQGDSVFVGSSIYTASGTYTDTLVTTQGCDSIVQLTLVVQNVGFSLADTTFVCEGDQANIGTPDSISIGFPGIPPGNSLTLVPGTYDIELTNDLNGCSAVQTISVEELPLPVVVIEGDSAVCIGDTATLVASGGTEYAWSNGAQTETISVTDIDTYSVTATDSNGCQGEASFTIDTLPPPTIEIFGDTSFCPGGSTVLVATGAATYTWSNGQTGDTILINAPGTYSVEGVTVDGCIGQASTTVVELPLPDVAIEGDTAFCAGESATLVATGAETYTWSNGLISDTISVDVPGTYTVVGISAEGCENEAMVTVEELPLPDVFIDGQLAFCEGESTVLFANGADSYSWSNGSTTDSIVVSDPGNYILSGTSADGCTAEDTVVVEVLPLPDVIIEGDDTFCAGDGTVLTATGAATFVWSNGLTGDSINVTVPGIYTVEGTSAEGCISLDTIEVEELPLPDVAIDGATTFCAGQSTILTASGAESYTWSNGETGTSITVTTQGTYTVTGVSADGCEAEASVDVEQLPLPDVDIDGTLTICEGDSTVLTASGALSYDWSTQEQGASITVSAPGPYSVVGTSADGCVSSESVTVIQFANPSADILGETQVCGNDETTLTAVGGTTYVWSNGVTDAEVNVGPGTYTVTVTDANGCEAEASVTVEGDDEAPELLFCPSNVNGVLNFGQTEVAVSWVEPVAEDNCGDDNLAVDATHQPGDTFGLGTTTVTYTFTDGAGNTTTCSFDVVVSNSADLTFYVDTEAYTISNDTFCVPVRVLDFDEVVGFQFTVVAPDNVQSRIFEIEPAAALGAGGGGTVGGLNVSNVDDNNYLLLWADGNSQGLTLPDSAVAFTVKMVITAAVGECVPLGFDSEPLDIEAVQVPDVAVVPTVIGGDVCVLNPVDISGRIYKINNEPVGDVEVLLDSPQPVTDFTNVAGLYEFEEQDGGLDYTVIPSKDTNYADGVSIQDIVIINRHILTADTLDSPYLEIAADVNGSEFVTIADLTEIRDLLLGVLPAFSGSPSWRFVPVSYMFPEPLEPWLEDFPEVVELPGLDVSVDDIDFYAIKMGDVTLNATGNLTSGGGSGSTLNLMAPEQSFRAGQLVEVPVVAHQLEGVAGFQFELSFDPEVMIFAGLETYLPDLDARHSFSLQQVSKGLLPVVWYDKNMDFVAGQEEVLFTLRFRAQRDGKLQESLWLSEDKLPAQTVNRYGQAAGIDFSLGRMPKVDAAVAPAATVPNPVTAAPNPFTSATEINLNLEQEGEVTFTVFDLNGRILLREKQQMSAGFNNYTVRGELLPNSGIYLCRVQSPSFVQTVQLIKQ